MPPFSQFPLSTGKHRIDLYPPQRFALCSRSPRKWNRSGRTLPSGFFHSVCFESHLRPCVCQFAHSSALMRSSSLYENTAILFIYLPNYRLLGSLQLSLLLWVKLLWTFVSESSRIYVFISLCFRFSWVNTLEWNCWVIESGHLYLCKTLPVFQVDTLFHTPTSDARGFWLFCIRANIWYCPSVQF